MAVRIPGVMSNLLHPAYLAGIIDGEGSVFLRYRNNPHISITNTNEELIESLKLFGGHTQERVGRGLGSQQSWDWVITGERAAIILERCLPYLLIKRDKAEKALAAWRSGDSPNRKHYVTKAREGFKELEW